MPNAGDEFTARLLKAFKLKLQQRLKDPLRLMNRLGALVLASSQDAFDRGELGSYRWARRYPNMGEGDTFVNIAGIVSDFQQGIEPPKRRFQARPPLLDKGYLRRTLKDKSSSIRLLGSHQIQIGTTTPYAKFHQWGGQTEQFVTDAVRKNLATWLNEGPKKNKVKRVRSDPKTNYIGTLTRRQRYGNRLGFLFRQRVLYTKVNQRPFIGITPDTRHKLIQATVDFFEKK